LEKYSTLKYNHYCLCCEKRCCSAGRSYRYQCHVF